MWQSFIFGAHWMHEGKLYYDEFSAESKEEATEYFMDHKRDDVTLVRIDLIRPNEGGVREPAHSPILPMPPLMARKNPGTDLNAR
jgi:hypothetical protein